MKKLIPIKYIIILNLMCFKIRYIITKCHKIYYTYIFLGKKIEHVYYFLFIIF